MEHQEVDLGHVYFEMQVRHLKEDVAEPFGIKVKGNLGMGSNLEKPLQMQVFLSHGNS